MSLLISRLLKSNKSSESSPLKITPVQVTPSELIDLAVAESAQSDLAKRSKLGVAFDALFLGHFGQIAQEEVKSVAAYREKHKNRLGSAATGGNVPSDDMNIIVCDNINEKQDPPQPQQQQQSHSSTLPWVLTAALAAAGLTAGAAYLLNRPEKTSNSPAPAPIQQPTNGTSSSSGVGSTTQLIQGK